LLNASILSKAVKISREIGADITDAKGVALFILQEGQARLVDEGHPDAACATKVK
jgi:hypothetical protein